MIDSQWITTITALGGAVVGGTLTQVTGWFDRRNKRQVLLRTKYEELGTHYLNSLQSFSKLYFCQTRAEVVEVAHQEDATKAQLLAMLYFPELVAPTNQLVAAFSDVYRCAGAIFDEKDKRTLGNQVAGNRDMTVVNEAYAVARVALQTEIRKYASTYTKS